ncbi:Zinc finger protein [Fasciola gigantica]|uniref:Zinc finger protein n=1 Tax=Fasciola gigantica TaxID=46835 RepID=A0A504YM24_FASGI|nr:Zinc finger protein [Fasciola gigantica]
MTTSENDQASTKLCPICHEDIDFFAYGACNHPTCTKCILKLRKFGSVDEPDFSKCPTCRRNLNKIVIMESFVPFNQVNTSTMRHDAKYDFVYPSQHIERYYRDMLRSICPVCGEEKISLSALNRHTTMEHHLSYCDLCIRYARVRIEFFHPSSFNKLVATLEQCELLTHYGEAHHLCAECRQQQRISCFSTAENLGLHRFQEHPDAVNNDPDSWMPISIELARNSDIVAHRRRDPLRQDIDHVGGVLNSTDGRLVAEGTQAGVRFRRPNPSEWTGDDFPALAASGAPGSQPQTERSESVSGSQVSTGDSPTTRQTDNARPASRTAGQPGITLAALTGRGRSTRLTADDFPSLSNSGAVNVATAPTWIKTSSIGARSPVTNGTGQQNQPRPKQTQQRPTASDFPNLPHESGRSLMPNRVDVLPNSTETPSDTSMVQPPVSADWGPEEFPSLDDPVPPDGKTTIKSSTTNKQTKSRKKLAGPKIPPQPAKTMNQIESLVPKVPTIEHKKTVKKTPVPSVPGLSKHDWIDTECVLYAATPYIPVPEEEARNRELIRTVELELFDVSGKTGFTRFADLSRRYRHKQLTATAYMEALVGLVTPRNSGTVVADSGDDAPKSPVWIAPMLALLPDVGLQRALLRVLQGQGAPKIPQELLPPDCAGRRVREPITTPPAWAKSVLNLVQCCRVCGQVCLRTDMQVHLEQAHS